MPIILTYLCGQLCLVTYTYCLSQVLEETGLRIEHRESVLKLLHDRKVEIVQSLVELGGDLSWLMLLLNINWF